MLFAKDGNSRHWVLSTRRKKVFKVQRKKNLRVHMEKNEWLVKLNKGNGLEWVTWSVLIIVLGQVGINFNCSGQTGSDNAENLKGGETIAQGYQKTRHNWI